MLYLSRVLGHRTLRMLDLSTFAFYSAVVLAVGFALYRAALPKPIPGIPYNVESAKNILGEL